MVTILGCICLGLGATLERTSSELKLISYTFILTGVICLGSVGYEYLMR